MNGSVVRTTSGRPRTWRMRPWPGDPNVAHLVFVDHASVPVPDDLDRAIEQAGRLGATAVRTSAMFPAARDVVLGFGFTPIDRLALLSRSTDQPVPAAERTPRLLLRWHHRQAARVDRDAFGQMWGNDPAGIGEIRRATPTHHARMLRDRRRLVAFAMSGAAGDHGYLQRVAVASTHRRHGLARDLVLDALTWMHDIGLRTVLVNTGIANEPALALYEGLGFRRLDDELTIAELRLTGPGDVRSSS